MSLGIRVSVSWTTTCQSRIAAFKWGRVYCLYMSMCYSPYERPPPPLALFSSSYLLFSESLELPTYSQVSLFCLFVGWLVCLSGGLQKKNYWKDFHKTWWKLGQRPFCHQDFFFHFLTHRAFFCTYSQGNDA